VERPYKSAWTTEAARDQILKESGTHFDPRVVEAFNAVYKHLVDVMRRAEELETQAALPGRAPRMLDKAKTVDE
jgi:putative two-component system response regulator